MRSAVLSLSFRNHRTIDKDDCLKARWAEGVWSEVTSATPKDLQQNALELALRAHRAVGVQTPPAIIPCFADSREEGKLVKVLGKNAQALLDTGRSEGGGEDLDRLPSNFLGSAFLASRCLVFMAEWTVPSTSHHAPYLMRVWVHNLQLGGSTYASLAGKLVQHLYC